MWNWKSFVLNEGRIFFRLGCFGQKVVRTLHFILSNQTHFLGGHFSIAAVGEYEFSYLIPRKVVIDVVYQFIFTKNVTKINSWVL